MGAMRKDYPYTARVGTCKVSSKNMTKVNSSYRRVYSNRSSSLVNAISQNVVTVCINASKVKLYKSGVFSDWSCPTNINHMVSAVGYGQDAATGKLYYRIR